MANTEPEAGKHQHWSYGTPVLKNGHYLLSTFGRYAISFVLGALTAAFVVGGKSRDLSDLLIWKGEVNATLQRMDAYGTNASKWMLAEETAKIQANTSKIEDLYKKVEPIGTMQSKIEDLRRDVPTKK